MIDQIRDQTVWALKWSMENPIPWYRVGEESLTHIEYRQMLKNTLEWCDIMKSNNDVRSYDSDISNVK